MKTPRQLFVPDVPGGTCDAHMCRLGGPVACAFLDGFPRTPPELPPFQMALGGVRLANTGAAEGWFGTFAFTRALCASRATYKSKGR